LGAHDRPVGGFQLHAIGNGVPSLFGLHKVGVLFLLLLIGLDAGGRCGRFGYADVPDSTPTDRGFVLAY